MQQSTWGRLSQPGEILDRSICVDGDLNEVIMQVKEALEKEQR